MTRQEFIIQYVLQHKVMPTDMTLDMMEKNHCFDEIVTVKSEEPVDDNPEEDTVLFNGFTRNFNVVTTDKVDIGRSVIAPAGFVVRVLQCTEIDDFVRLRIRIKLSSGRNGYTHQIDCSREWILRHLKLVNFDVPVSTVIDSETGNGKTITIVRGWGNNRKVEESFRKEYRYEVDESSLRLE